MPCSRNIIVLVYIKNSELLLPNKNVALHIIINIEEVYYWVHVLY